MIHLSDVNITNADREVHRLYTESIYKLKHSMYIFHIDMIKFITAEIHFFYQLNYITKEEVEALINSYSVVLWKILLKLSPRFQRKLVTLSD